MNVSLATANWSITVRSISGFGFIFFNLLKSLSENGSYKSCKVLIGSLLPDYIFKRISPLMVLAVAIIGNGIGLSLLPTFPGTSSYTAISVGL